MTSAIDWVGLNAKMRAPSNVVPNGQIAGSCVESGELRSETHPPCDTATTPSMGASRRSESGSVQAEETHQSEWSGAWKRNVFIDQIFVLDIESIQVYD